MRLLSKEEAAGAAREAVSAFQHPDNAKRLSFAKDDARGDIGSFFGGVIPVAIEIVGPTLGKFGFEVSENGAMNFLQALGQHQDEPELKAMLSELNAKFMPESD